MKILIVGTGGVGGFYGGLLAKAGNDVTFLARGEHARAMRESGLHVKSTDGDFVINPVQVIASLTEAETPELVLVCVKSYDLEQVARNLRPIVEEKTVVLPLQNGIDSEQIIRNVIPNAVVVSGTTYLLSKRSAPGMIEQTGGLGNIIFGDRNRQNQELLNHAERVLRDAGIDAKNTEDIEREVWRKYIWILGFAGMTSLCRSSLGAIANDPNTMSIYYRCLREAFSVADALKVNVNEDDYAKFVERIESLKKTNPDAKASMLVDIENHRRTEIESLHGKLVQLAKKSGIDVPVNEIIYYTVRLTQPQPVLMA